MKYREDKTQEQRILALLQERGNAGVYVYELIAPRPQGLGIAQYNARIKGLRGKNYNIINDVIGHFVLLEGLTSQVSNNTPLESQPERANLATNPLIEEKREKFPYLFNE